MANINKALTSDKQNRQQEVREQSSKVNDFAGPADALPDAKVTEHPDQEQGPGELPADVADVFDAAGDLEGSPPAEILKFCFQVIAIIIFLQLILSHCYLLTFNQTEPPER